MQQSHLQHFLFHRNYFSTTVECDTNICQILVLNVGVHECFGAFAYKCDVLQPAACNKPPLLNLISTSQASSPYPNISITSLLSLS